MSIIAFIGAAIVPILISLLLGIIVFVPIVATGIKERRVSTDYGTEVDKYIPGTRMLLAITSALLVALLAFGLMAAFNSYTTIERGNVGLVTRFGRLIGTVFPPGLNWKSPFIERVEIIDTTQQAYEMSSHPEESKATWTDYSVSSQTSDGQTVSINATTIFRIPTGDAAVNIRQNIGPIAEVVENVVKANTRSITRNLSKTFEAEQLYTGDIIAYQDAVRDELEKKFAQQGEGLVLADFLIRGIKFEDKYSDAVEEKQIAAENIVTQQNNAQAAIHEAQKIAELAKGDAQATIERAKGDAERVRLNADASAYAVEIDADAQAYATEEIGRALERYQTVLSLRFIESLNDKTLFLPTEGIDYLLPLEDAK
jgi:regulator of protease activity HflC (stomatin/prohibitin superfamily)